MGRVIQVRSEHKLGQIGQRKITLDVRYTEGGKDPEVVIHIEGKELVGSALEIRQQLMGIIKELDEGVTIIKRSAPVEKK